MKTPLISVIMSAYNAEKFIAIAIKSILNQTYADFEFIIINDGSTDKTKEIIKSFTDERIVLIDKPKNAGLIAALNDGLEIAKGEFIARMDADDESLKQRFKLQIEFMQENPNIDVLGVAVLVIYDGKNNKILTYPKIHSQCINRLIIAPCTSHPAVMMRKKALKNIKYNENYSYAEDYKLWVDLAMDGAKFANLQQPLLKYNWHGENISITKIDEQNKCAGVIRHEYFNYYFNGEFDLLFDANKIVSLQKLSQFYNSAEKKMAMRNFIRVYVRNNIASFNYSFNSLISIPVLLYYLRYKIKDFFKK